MAGLGRKRAQDVAGEGGRGETHVHQGVTGALQAWEWPAVLCGEGDG